MKQKSLVPAAQWRRGVAATERIGRLLKRWDDRARLSRAGEEPPARRPRTRRAP